MKSKLTASKIRNPHLVLEQDPPVDQGDVQIEIAMARLLAVPERELVHRLNRDYCVFCKSENRV